MRLTVRHRFLPYSHLPGTRAIIPGTPYVVEVFPALIRVAMGDKVHSFPVDVKGPVDRFTVCQDLEKGRILVTGEGIGAIEIVHREGFLHVGPHRIPSLFAPWVNPSMEKIHLGANKALDWELVMRRKEPLEYLPVLYQLAQWTPPATAPLQGTAKLLGPKEEELSSFFLAAFSSLLVPSFSDLLHQGIIAEESGLQGDPTALLSSFQSLFRSLFFVHERGHISLLPSLPPRFVAGRFVQIPFEGGSLSFDWRKKSVRRAELSIYEPTQLSFSWKGGTKMRQRKSVHEKGELIKAGERNLYMPGRYMLDRFF